MTTRPLAADPGAGAPVGRRLLVLAEDRAAATAAAANGFGAEATVRVLDPPTFTGTRRFVREVGAARARGDAIVLFVRGRRVSSFRFVWGCLLAITLFPGASAVLGPSGTTHPVWRSLFRLAWPLAPLLSIAQFFLIPVYLVRELLPALFAGGGHGKQQVVGYGHNRGAGGQVYWLIFPPKVRRFGLFGLAHDSYMGMPLGVHSWPLSVAALTVLGYRALFLVSTAMIAGAAYWLFAQFGHTGWAWVIPVTLLSNYYLFNLVAGTWEVLAWGFGTLMVASLLAGMPVLAGLFAAALLLCHPGVTMLVVATTVALMLTGIRPLAEFVLIGVVAAALGVWWLIPYRAASAKLGRARMLVEVWKDPLTWSLPMLYQFVAFAVLTAAALIHGGFDAGVVLIVGLAALYVNTRVAWIFSQYTVMNLMLVLGLIELAMRPSVPLAIAYGFVVFTPPVIIWPRCGRLLGFDLAPIRIGDNAASLRELVAPVDGRLALELGRMRTHPGWSSIASITYLLADSHTDLFTAAYAEIGDYEIYRRTIAWFNDEASRQEFQAACELAGVRYFLAITESFRDRLLEWGCEAIGQSGPLSLSDIPNGESVTLTLFRLPWPTGLIEPPVLDLVVEPNHIRFTGEAGMSYALKYSAFRGWRATESDRPLTVSDACPGIRLDVSVGGPVDLRYSLSNYFRRA